MLRLYANNGITPNIRIYGVMPLGGTRAHAPSDLSCLKKIQMLNYLQNLIV